MSTHSRTSVTEAQSELLTVLDDVSEHVNWEFAANSYDGFSTCGFAHIGNIDGRSSFVRRIDGLAESNDTQVRSRSDGSYTIRVAGLDLSLRADYDSGYRLTLNNVGEFVDGVEYQRLDVRERLHELIRERLQYNAFIEDAHVRSRMD